MIPNGLLITNKSIIPDFYSNDSYTKTYHTIYNWCLDNGIIPPVNDNVKVYQKIIQKYTTSTECCKGTKSLLYITYC